MNWREDPDDPDCPFCRIARDDPEGQIEQRVNGALVITPLNPVTFGHKLVIPPVHVEDFAEEPFISGMVMQATADYIQSERVGDCNVITSRGRAATQTVFHLHVHIVPREPDDGIMLPWSTP